MPKCRIPIQQTVIASVQVWFLNFFSILILVQQAFISSFSWFSFCRSCLLCSFFVPFQILCPCLWCKIAICFGDTDDFVLWFISQILWKCLFLSCIWVTMTQMRLSECLAYEFICCRSCLGWLMLSRSCVSGLFVLESWLMLLSSYCCSWILLVDWSSDPHTKQLFRFLKSLSQFLMLVFRDFNLANIVS